jgi:hypothetical protein
MEVLSILIANSNSIKFTVMLNNHVFELAQDHPGGAYVMNS